MKRGVKECLSCMNSMVQVSSVEWCKTLKIPNGWYYYHNHHSHCYEWENEIVFVIKIIRVVGRRDVDNFQRVSKHVTVIKSKKKYIGLVYLTSNKALCNLYKAFNSYFVTVWTSNLKILEKST